MQRRLFLSALLALAALPVRADERAAGRPLVDEKTPLPPLYLGIVPFNSPLLLLRTHLPLRAHLEQALGQPVLLYSAPDHARFYQDALQSKFDAIIISPHFAVMLLKQGLFAPLLRYRANMNVSLVTRVEDQIYNTRQLRGKRIGLPDALSVFAVGGIRWLQAHNMHPGQDYTLSEWPSHGAMLMAIAQGRLDAGLSVANVIRQLPDDTSARLTSLSLDEDFPHLMTLARVDLGEAQIERLRAAFARFPDTPAGLDFFQKTGYFGYTTITPHDVETMQPYVKLTEQLMQRPE